MGEGQQVRSLTDEAGDTQIQPLPSYAGKDGLRYICPDAEATSELEISQLLCQRPCVTRDRAEAVPAGRDG